MAKKPKESKFKGKVGSNAQKTKNSGATYGYLNLPRGVSVFAPEPGGKMRFDIMPYKVTDPKHPDRDDAAGIAVVGDYWYKRPFKIHRNIGASKDSVVCLTSIGKKCPICEYRAQMIKEGRDKEDTDPLKTSNRNLYVVIPIKHKKMEEVPHIFDISQAMFQNLLTEELQEDDQYEVFPDLEQGYTLRVRFDSKTIGNSKPFAEASRIDFEERDAYPETILDDIPELDNVLNIKDYQTLEKLFLEIEDGEGDDEKEEKDSRRKPEKEKEKRTGRPGKEKEDEDVFNDDTDEDEKPKRGTRPTRKPEPEPEPESEPEEKDEDACIACEGSGTNSKGRTCPICKGTGEGKKEPFPEVKPEPKKQEPARSSGKGGKCPFGHVFGTDCEKFDDCNDCDKWDSCIDAKEG